MADLVLISALHQDDIIIDPSTRLMTTLRRGLYGIRNLGRIQDFKVERLQAHQANQSILWEVPPGVYINLADQAIWISGWFPLDDQPTIRLTRRDVMLLANSGPVLIGTTSIRGVSPLFSIPFLIPIILQVYGDQVRFEAPTPEERNP